MESVLYLMADKFLEPSVLNKLKEEQEFIINALKLGLSDADILRLTECTPDELQAARNLWLTQK